MRSESPRGEAFPRQMTGGSSPLIWGVAFLVVIEATLLSLFAVSYFYLRLGTPVWPPADVPDPDLLLPTVAQLLLLASTVPVWLGLRAVARNETPVFLLGLAGGLVLAASYLVLTVVSYWGRTYTWASHTYGSLDWSMSAYAGLHVVVVLLTGCFIGFLGLKGHFGSHRYTGVQALLVYWIFVAAGSLLFWGVQYLTPLTR